MMLSASKRVKSSGSVITLSLGCATSALALAWAAPAAAQDSQAPAADEVTDEAIVVTGLRGSLQRKLDVKRTSSGVVDVISAEEIGKFPDSTVAASMQRLPGVSSQRRGSNPAERRVGRA